MAEVGQKTSDQKVIQLQRHIRSRRIYCFVTFHSHRQFPSIRSLHQGVKSTIINIVLMAKVSCKANNLPCCTNSLKEKLFCYERLLDYPPVGYDSQRLTPVQLAIIAGMLPFGVPPLACNWEVCGASMAGTSLVAV